MSYPRLWKEVSEAKLDPWISDVHVVIHSLLLQLHLWRNPLTGECCSSIKQNVSTSDMCTGGRAEEQCNSSEIRGVAKPS